MSIRPQQAYSNGRVLNRKEVSGFVLEEVLDSPRSKVPQHSHEAAYFCIALNGNCIERFGTKTRECRALSWGFFPAGEAHSFEIDSTVSEAVGVHAVHLAREFRKHYGCTAGDYVRQLRIEYAFREIGRSGSSLAEIASAAGFSDQSHFSKVFRRFTGMTPANYRAALSIR